MPRQGTSSRLREDADRERTGNEPDTPEPPLDMEDEAPVPPTVAETKTIETEMPPLLTTPRRKGRSGVLTLIVIAILGVAIGFAAVMLM